MTSNQIAYAKVVEEALANRNKEALTRESNRIQENSNAIAYMNAETNRYQANIRAQEVQNNYLLQSARQAEEQRHNIETERQTAEYQTQSNYLRQKELYQAYDVVDQKYAAMRQEADITKYVQQQENQRAKKSNISGILGKLVGPGIAAATAFLGI